jgi:hypothetical protein
MQSLNKWDPRALLSEGAKEDRRNRGDTLRKERYRK